MSYKTRILLVDDSKTQLIRLQMAFERKVYTVLSASDGLEGVSWAFSERPDIVVSDIMMPELNGYQLCRLLKNDQLTSHIPIILLTSLDQKQDRFWGIRAGADQYIVKSSDLSGLESTVEKLLQKQPTVATSEAEGRPVSNQRTTQDHSQSARSASIKSNVNRLLDQLLFESTLSSEARQLANFIHDKEALLKEVLDLVSSLVDYSCLCLCLFDRRGSKFYFDLKQPLPENELTKVQADLVTIMVEEDKGKQIETFFFKSNAEFNQEVGDQGRRDQIVSRLIVPLNIHNECIGHLYFLSTREKAFAPKTENIIQLLAKDFSMVFKLMLLYDETRELSIKDGLTNLYNKRYFLEILEKEFDRSRRFGSTLSLIIMDIDHFKAVNDIHGHLQGDSVLREMGDIVAQSIRKIDIPARYGGEEFVIIVPNTSLQEAKIIAEKIRKTTEAHAFKAENTPMKITISLGISTLNGKVCDKLALVKFADDALYKAKHSGRNQVCLAED